jgi:hypothetical protein
MASEDRERWDRRYKDASNGQGEVPDWLDALTAEIPVAGKALRHGRGA